MVEKQRKDPVQRQSLWSGSVTFGLVSIPVNLLSGLRSRQVSLRRLAPDGTPLRRRYFCPREDRPLERDEIVRGYEIEPDRFVVVEDAELDALAPEKSREIDLRRFVPMETVDPRFFDRPYFLVPDEGAKKAYLLLADAMERTGRAGIATFVMRGKAYLVAILAENGILRAETLRFADEIRTLDEVGLKTPPRMEDSTVDDLVEKIRAARSQGFSPKELEDTYADRLLELVRAKERAGRDVVEVAEEMEEDDDAPRGEVIDLMDILKQRLEGRGAEKRPAAGATDLKNMTRQDLYEAAKKKNIPGRSRMSREELMGALRKSGKSGR
ncbi:MAG: Ku protein [Desulfobacterales bacterium]